MMGGMKGYNHANERKLSSHQSGETVINIRKKIIKNLLFLEIQNTPSAERAIGMSLDQD
jgi:hypothetical protein